jgi:hypothetical protein
LAFSLAAAVVVVVGFEVNVGDDDAVCIACDNEDVVPIMAVLNVA